MSPQDNKKVYPISNTTPTSKYDINLGLNLTKIQTNNSSINSCLSTSRDRNPLQTALKNLKQNDNRRKGLQLSLTDRFIFNNKRSNSVFDN